MKLLKYEGYNLTFEPELLTLSVFKKLHSRDKTKDKSRFTSLSLEVEENTIPTATRTKSSINTNFFISFIIHPSFYTTSQFVKTLYSILSHNKKIISS